MKRRTVLVLILMPLLVIAARTGYRYLWSCKRAARDISHLSLGGSVQVISCEKGLPSTSTRIVLALDSIGTAVAAKEAQAMQYLPMESLGDTVVRRSVYEPLAGKHGWFYSTFGKNANGGYVLVYLDVVARRISVEAYSN